MSPPLGCPFSTAVSKSSRLATQASFWFLCVTRFLAMVNLGPRTGHWDPVLGSILDAWRTRNERIQPVLYWAASKRSPLQGFSRTVGQAHRQKGMRRGRNGEGGVRKIWGGVSGAGRLVSCRWNEWNRPVNQSVQMPHCSFAVAGPQVGPHNLFLFLPQFLRGNEASSLSMLQTCGL